MKRITASHMSRNKSQNDDYASVVHDYAEIKTMLGRARRFIRFNKIWHYSVISAVFSLLVVLAVEVLFRAVIFDNRRMFEVAGTALFMAYALLWPLFRRMSDLRTARVVDAEFGTKERIATAVELQNSGMGQNQILGPGMGTGHGPATGFKHKVVSDAARVCATIRLSEGFSYRPPNRILAVFAVLFLVNAVLLYTPNPGDRVLAESKAFAKQLEAEKTALVKKRTEIAKNGNLNKKDKEELLKKIDDLLKEISARKLTKEETVAKLAGFEQELEKKRPTWGKGSDEMLQRLARKMSGNPELEKLSSALQQRNFKKAADEAKNLSKLSNLSGADRKRLASGLSKMADSAAPVDPRLAEALEKLSNALQSGNVNANGIASSADRLSDALTQAGGQASLEQMASALSDQLAQSRLALAQSGQQGQQSFASADPSGGDQNSSSGQSGVNSTGSQGSGGRSANSGQGNNSGQTGQSPGNSSGQGNQGGQGNSGGGGGIGAGSSARSGISSANRDFGDIRLDRDRKVGKYEAVYAPELIDANTRDERLSGTKTQGEETLESMSLPPSREEALIPYKQAYYHYYDTAVEALNKGEIPVGMENAVKNYFGAVQPGK
jgi:hypothetical protein